MTIKTILLTRMQAKKAIEIASSYEVEIGRTEKKDDLFSAVTMKGHDGDVKSFLNVL